MRALDHCLFNTREIELWPARLLRARRSADARALARARWVLRRKRDGAYLAAELPEALLPLLPRLRHEPGLNEALALLEWMGTSRRASIAVLDAPLSTDFWFEMDVEIVASAAPPPHFGFWLWTGVATYEGHRLCVYNNNWAHSYWTSGGSESENIAEAWAGWAVVGAVLVTGGGE